MENTDWYLAVKKRNQGLGLKSLELLILSQIDEFQSNGLDCYMTNEQFSYLFGESVSKVKRSLDRLEELNVVKRNVSFVQGNGKANKQRVLSLNKREKWKVHNEPCKIMEGHSEPSKSDLVGHSEPSKIKMEGHIEPCKSMEGSKIDDGRFKTAKWKVHNEPIKDKEKKNKRKEERYADASLEGRFAPMSHPSDALLEKEKHFSETDCNPMARKISSHCGCPVEEIEIIINDNGLDYDAVLHCVENGYINGKNLYSKTYWDSMNVNDILRDPTYAEYLVGMYKSNPDGLAESDSSSMENIYDDVMTFDTEDMSWLADLADWAEEE